MLIMYLLLFTVSMEGAPSGESWSADYERVSARYRVQEAEQLADRLRNLTDAEKSPDFQMLLAKTLLLLANWHRLAYERLVPEAAEQRRSLGKAIDSAAQEGLGLLGALGESAEVWRLRADFYGTMIRTSHQAKKYLESMDDALAKALELAPDNADVLVSKARRRLFADSNHGGDVAMAMDILNKALETNPDHESALLLRGLARMKLNRQEDAIADWQRALKNNPDCTPAREELAERGKLP